MKKENVVYAYLAGTATKTDKELFFYPRRQPLRIPDNSATIAVIRIDDRSAENLLTDEDMEQISDFVINSCGKSGKNISCMILYI